MNKKNVITLGILDSNTIPPSGVKNTYYMYYKSDKDLYMYDSENNIEYNLFHLETLDSASDGTLRVITNILANGRLKVSAKVLDVYAPPRLGTLNVSTNIIDDYVTGIRVTILDGSNITVGTLFVSTFKDDSVGNLDLTVLSDAGTLGLMSVSTLNEPATGDLDITIYDTEDLILGYFNVSTFKNPAVGNLKLTVLEQIKISQGILNISTFTNPAKGNLRVTIYEEEVIEDGMFRVLTNKSDATGNLNVKIYQL